MKNDFHNFFSLYTLNLEVDKNAMNLLYDGWEMKYLITI